MPNWCENRACVTAPTEAGARRLYDAFQRGETCGEFLPIPGSDPGWYWKRTASWGVKWDFGKSDEGGVAVLDSAMVELAFDSAWSPPTAFYEHLESLGFTVDAMFLETGMCFCGYFRDGQLRQVRYDRRSDIPGDIEEEWGSDLFDWIFDFEEDEA